MASRTTPVRKARRSLIWLAVLIAALAGLQTAGASFWGWGWTPRLALDLEGGTQMILQAQVAEGDQVTDEQLSQAVAIIRDRVDASGVSEAEITTQGGRNVVVSIPGEPDEATLQRIQASARLDFRPVLLAGLPSTPTPEASGEPSPGAEDPEAPATDEEAGTGESTEGLGADGGVSVDGQVATSAASTAVGTEAPAETPAPEAPVDGEPQPEPSASPTNASDPAWITPELQQEFDTFDCATLDDASLEPADPDVPLVTCEQDGSVKYLLGPVEVSGERIADATNGMITTQQGASTGAWAVNIRFNGEGTREFGDVTTRLVQEQQPRNQFGIVLDGRVVSAPTTQAAITDGKPQITGQFTQESSKTLADQLKYGALPLSFALQSQDNISATLGSSQLEAGILAALIGIVLVIIYSFFQYRVLSSVTIASILVAAILTYFVITILSWREGLRLSIAGVAGLVVAIGFTADSFIVYFERVRDELRDGRGLTGAVEAGWKRALRTIWAAKGINMLSAIVLFVLAVGNVRGFAYTLGITVIIDVLVVVLFTHPMLQLLATTKFFQDGHRWSGLDPKALGAVYRGRAEFRVSKEARRQGASREAQRRQTIAERKAAESVGAGARKGEDD